MWDGVEVVDADGHVMEPASLWLDYIAPEFRETCLRVARDPDDGDKLLVGGRPSQLIRRLGGVVPKPGQPVQDWNSLTAGPFAAYQESCAPASYDGAARVAWLDAHGIETTFLFPSLGLIWPREVDPTSPYGVAHLRAYNRWIMDFAAVAPGRLVPAGQLALSPAVPLETEVKRLAAAGFGHVMLPFGIGVGGQLGPELDPFWAAAAEYGITIHLHKIAIPHLLQLPSPTSLRAAGMGSFFNHVNEILPGQLFLTALFDARVPDRFPDLRFAFHECNAGWLPAWLDRADESHGMLRGTAALLPDRLPSEYLYGQDTFFFSVGLGEQVGLLPAGLHSRLMLATDYPHPGTPDDPRADWHNELDKFPGELRRAVVGDNAARLLGSDRH